MSEQESHETGSLEQDTPGLDPAPESAEEAAGTFEQDEEQGQGGN